MSLNLEKLNLQNVGVGFLSPQDENGFVLWDGENDINEVVQSFFSNEESERCFGVIFEGEDAIGVVKGYDEIIKTTRVSAIKTLRKVIDELEIDKMLILEKEDDDKYKVICE